MRGILKIFCILFAAVLFSSVFLIALEDPDHFLNPEPTCTICKVLHTQLVYAHQALTPLAVSVFFTPVDDAKPIVYICSYANCISIRGPPLPA